MIHSTLSVTLDCGCHWTRYEDDSNEVYTCNRHHATARRMRVMDRFRRKDRR